MKKYFQMLLVLAVATALVTSCGKTENSEIKVNKAAMVDSQNSYNQVYKIKTVTKGAEGTAVNFTFDENGTIKSFAETTKGKVVFLNFWGTWCGPCRREIPDIIKLQENYKDKGLMVIGIALEQSEAKAYSNVVSFGSKQKMNYMNLLDNQNQMQIAYGSFLSVPNTFIIDKKGKIVENIVGSMGYEDFEKIVQKYIQ